MFCGVTSESGAPRGKVCQWESGREVLRRSSVRNTDVNRWSPVFRRSRVRAFRESTEAGQWRLNASLSSACWCYDVVVVDGRSMLLTTGMLKSGLLHCRLDHHRRRSSRLFATVGPAWSCLSGLPVRSWCGGGGSQHAAGDQGVENQKSPSRGCAGSRGPAGRCGRRRRVVVA